MPRIKPTFDGAEATSGFYDGPPPIPGTYRGMVKKMGLAKIRNGDNAGADRISLLLEITEGKFKGAGIWHSLNLTTNSAWAVNQFLDALTDGSDRQKNGLRDLFWHKGYEVEAKPEGKLGQQFLNIGGKFKPIGKPVAFVTKMDSYEGTPKAAIDKFVVALGDSSEESNEDALDGLNEFAPQDDSENETVSIEEETVSVGAEDSDDPWA